MSAIPQMLQWVKAAGAGEEQAWAGLYNRYFAGLYAIALGICPDADVAKDAVQDAFITAYLKISQLKDAEAFSGWIKQIVIRNCYRALRKNTFHEIDTTLSNRWFADEQNRQSDMLDMQGRLYASLASLPQVLHTTLLLRYFSGFQSYHDIASILSVPVGTVRSRLNQAKRKLVEEWQRSEDTGTKSLEQSKEWDHFYYAVFFAMHHQDNYKNRFIHHLQKDLQVVYPGGKQYSGRQLFEKMVMEDRSFGSWLEPLNVVSCGNISVIEARHFNSDEHPHHCPPRSVLVLYRNEKEVNKMSFHISMQ